jgi:ribosomal protein S18 acetylase RimI-like enzyme
MTGRCLSLRPAAPSDGSFLRMLYDGTRTAELAQFPWDAAQKEAFLKMQFEAQQGWYATAYPAAEHSIILLDERPAGRWMVQRDSDSILLVDIALLEEHRGKGIGGQLIERLIAESKTRHLPVRLQVQWTNQGALKLYRRLGFAIAGMDPLYCRMERKPPGPPVPAELISLRPAEASDDGLLSALYASTRADELAIVPWPPEQKQAFVAAQFAAQKQHYEMEYPHAAQQVICIGGETVGRLYLDRQPDVVHILDITVAPERRNCGIGTAVIESIRRQADADGKPVSIYVEDFNPSARLFRRLGFQVAEKNGFQLLLKTG